MKNKTKLILILSIFPFLLLGQDCIQPSNTLDVQWNNLEFTFAPGGSFLNPDINFVSNNSSNSSFSYATGICLSSIGEGQYRTATSSFAYPYPNTDFWTGPLRTSIDQDILGTAYGEEYCQNFDRFWNVNMDEVVAHLQDWNDNGSIDHVVSPNVLAWPARGNPEFEDITGWALPDERLAPFIDRNGNGLYEPMSGDYPAIKGTWNVWKLINDNGNVHTESNGNELRVTLSIMHYAFTSTDSTISNTYYTDIDLVNKGYSTLDSTIVSIFTDYDNLSQDLIHQEGLGCNPEKNYSFFYGLDDNENPPLDSTLIIQKILTVEEEQFSDQFSSFTYFANPGVGNPPIALVDPNNSVIEYVRLMSGNWRDNTPLTFGGNGYGGQTPTSFAFLDNPTDTDGWSMCTADLPKYDYRAYTSSLMGTFFPGAVRKYSYSTTFLNDYGLACPDFAEMNEISDKAEEVWIECETLTSLPKFAWNNQLKIYPNPIQNKLILSIDNQQINSIEVYSVAGQSILKQDNFNTASITLELPIPMISGLYFVKAKTENGDEYLQKIVKQ